MSGFTLKAIPTKCLKIVPSKTLRALSRQCQFSVISLGFRDVDERMIERGFDISFETIRKWVDKFGYTFTKRMMSRPERPSPGWHLDEIYTKINGKMIYLWRAVDDEGTILGIVIQSRRNTKATMRLLRKFRHQANLEWELATVSFCQ